MLNIRKIYKTNNVLALDKATLKVRKNTIHALVGENGAGKTTLMKILCGIEKKDAGEIRLNGKKVNIKNPRHAFSLGIGMVHQHFRLIDDFTVAENIVLGREITGKFGFITLRNVNSFVEKFSHKVGLAVEPSIKVRELSMGEKQKVEILKLLYRSSNIIVLDEPTSVLTKRETEELFKILRELKKQGKTIIFITHKLKEVFDISDEITVLRKGKTVMAGKTSELDEKKLACAIIGGKIPISTMSKKPLSNSKRVIIRVENLHVMDKKGFMEKVKGISFEVKAGEILAIAGVAGNGQKELAEAIFGMREVSSGRILLDGKDITFSSTRVRREYGMSCIPDDRIGEGCCTNASILENIIANRYYKLSNWTWIDMNNSKKLTEKLIKEYAIKTPSIFFPVGMLSGGNIQKVIIAREFSSDPKILIICEPTWGLDVRSERFVHEQIMKIKAQGKAILLISSNLDEIFKLSDRILVIYKGKIVAKFDNTKDLTKSLIGEYMIGLHTEKLGV